MKRMLINATQKEEVRVALVEGEKLYDLDIESAGFEQTKANIYKGRIAKLAPSLDAVFVDYGEDRHGFLPFKEITVAACLGLPAGMYGNGSLFGAQLKAVLKEGQEILVQISKGERGTKGAALTSFISLAGSYLVLMPNNPRASGISRRIEGEERNFLKQQLSKLQVPVGMGLIVRTAGVSKGVEDLEWDLNSLLHYWEAILASCQDHAAPCLIHQEGSILSRAIRDYLRRDIAEIIVDDPQAYTLIRERVRLFKPDFIDKVELYQGDIPLFNYFRIEGQIETAFQREVALPSGGSIVIDSTEALTAIDINSARSTRGGDIEETAYLTNLEAAVEVTRQFRLRDLGGLLVIDFIDMHSAKHQQAIEERIRESVKEDRARVQVGPLSRFGLMELSRQRLRPSLGESSSHTCPRCSGRGTVRGNESLALAILRLLEDAAVKGEVHTVCAVVPVLISSYLLNEKRSSVIRIEQSYGVRVLVVPDATMQTPEYDLYRFKDEQELIGFSYLIPKRMGRGERAISAGEGGKGGHLTPTVIQDGPLPSCVLMARDISMPPLKNECGPGRWPRRFWSWLWGQNHSRSSPKYAGPVGSEAIPSSAALADDRDQIPTRLFKYAPEQQSRMEASKSVDTTACVLEGVPQGMKPGDSSRGTRFSVNAEDRRRSRGPKKVKEKRPEGELEKGGRRPVSPESGQECSVMANQIDAHSVQLPAAKPIPNPMGSSTPPDPSGEGGQSGAVQGSTAVRSTDGLASGAPRSKRSRERRPGKRIGDEWGSIKAVQAIGLEEGGLECSTLKGAMVSQVRLLSPLQADRCEKIESHENRSGASDQVREGVSKSAGLSEEQPKLPCPPSCGNQGIFEKGKRSYHQSVDTPCGFDSSPDAMTPYNIEISFLPTSPIPDAYGIHSAASGLLETRQGLGSKKYRPVKISEGSPSVNRLDHESKR